MKTKLFFTAKPYENSFDVTREVIYNDRITGHLVSKSVLIATIILNGDVIFHGYRLSAKELKEIYEVWRLSNVYFR